MVRVQNIYYMLAYAFRVLHEQGYKDVATEEFANAAELLSAISGSALTFADGKPIVWISRWYKKPLKERLPTVSEFKKAGEHL